MPCDLVALSLSRMRGNFTAWRLRVDVVRLHLKLVGYGTDHLRIPAGQPGGGRWTDGGGSEDAGGDTRTILVGNEVPRYSISLEEEEARGGHTLRVHVGKTDAEVVEYIKRNRIRTPTPINEPLSE